MWGRKPGKHYSTVLPYGRENKGQEQGWKGGRLCSGTPKLGLEEWMGVIKPRSQEAVTGPPDRADTVGKSVKRQHCRALLQGKLHMEMLFLGCLAEGDQQCYGLMEKGPWCPGSPSGW